MAPKTTVEQAKEMFAGKEQPPAEKTEQLPSTEVLDPSAGNFVDGQEDVVVPPYLKLVQSMSDEAKSGKAKDGDFFFTGTEVVVKQPLAVVPMLAKRQWVQFDDGQLVFKTDKKLEALEHWGDDAWKFDGFVFLVYIRELQELAIFRLRSTSRAVALKFLNAGMGKKHMSSFAFELKSEERTKGKMRYFVVTARNTGGSSDEEKNLAAHAVKHFSPMFNKMEDAEPESGAEKETPPWE